MRVNSQPTLPKIKASIRIVDKLFDTGNIENGSDHLGSSTSSSHNSRSSILYFAFQTPNNMILPTADDTAKYCYEDPDTWAHISERKLQHSHLLVKVPRRSSLKQNGAPRRVSISRGDEIEVHLPGHAEPIKRRRSIDFSETTVVEEFKSCEDPFDNVWFNKDEYDDIRTSNKKIVKCVERGTTKNFCVRGLEPLMDDAQQMRRRNSIDTVLTEQQAQRDAGVFDADKLSESYRETSMESRAQAAGRAETDTADIQLYLKSAIMLLRRMSV